MDTETRAATSRSPSPASAPPVQTTPGPRATALQKLYSDATAHVLKTCNYANFSACFPTPAREVSAALKHFHEAFTRQLEVSMRGEFDTILEERHVVASLNELDGLVEEARRKKKGGNQDAPVAPHTLPAQQLYLSHLAPSLSQYSSALKERQDAVQEENIELLSRVMQQRKEIEGVVKGLESVVADLEASVATLNSGDAQMDGLKDEIRYVDEDMRMTA